MKIVLTGDSVDYKINARDEHMMLYSHIFEKYFNTIVHHYRESHEFNTDSILVFSYFPNSVRCVGCKQRDRNFNIERDSAPIGSSFFEDSFKNIPCGRLYHINYGGSLIGIYCKKNNILCMTDIAHDRRNMVHIEKIFKELESMGILKEKSKTKPRNKKVTLGADPEFETKVKDQDVSAYELPMFSTRDKVYISHDGHTQPQRELRPDPTDTPEELVENLRDLIKMSCFLGEELYVVGNKMPLGGHIHVGNAYPSMNIVKALDYFFIPFGSFNSDFRKASKYGKSGDVRTQPHGFEYRTPPSAWMVTPALATMTLALTKVIVENLINRKEITITDTFSPSTYEEDLRGLGFDQTWVDNFSNEISNIKTNLKNSLAKNWKCEIPTEYKIVKTYMKPKKLDLFIDAPLRSISQDMGIELDDICSSLEEEEEENE